MKLSALTNDAAIDLGTDNTRIYYKGNVTEEPSVIAYNTVHKNTIAVGNEAAEMLSKAPDTITVCKPLSKGVMVDFELTCRMLREFMSNSFGSVRKPRVLVTVPCGITDVERRAVCDAVRTSDIKEVYVIESPIAGAIGANCDVTLARGMMLVDIGGGCCDIAAISLGQTVVGRSVKIGGNDFDAALIKYVQEKHNLQIGEKTAEQIKNEVGCAFPRERDVSTEACGFNTKTRCPDKVLIHSEETREAFSPLLDKIVSEIKSALDETPTELLGDIMEDGILIVGGGAQLYGMAKKLRIELGVKVFLAEEAELCIARGAASVAENLDKLAETTYVYKKG